MIWILLFVLALSASPAGAQAAPKPAPERSELARREALLRKSLADEYFMADRRTDAEAEYERAQGLLDDHFAVGTDAASSGAIQFLRADIRFRRALLKQPGSDFFTTVVGPAVISPVEALNRLSTRAANISALTAEINVALNDATTSRTDAQMGQAQEQLNQRLAELGSSQAENTVADHSRRIRDLRAELDALAAQSETQRTVIRQEYETLRRREEEGITLILQETAKAAGLPTGLEGVSGAAAGQIAQIVGQAAAGALATPEAQEALRAAMVGIAAMRDFGGDPDSLAALVTTPALRARGLYRDRFFGLYSAVGRPLYARLSADQQNRLRGAVEARRPLLALVELAYTRPVVERAAREFLRGEGSALLAALPQEPAPADLERALVEWLRRTNSTPRRAFDGIVGGLPGAEQRQVMQWLAEQTLAGHSGVGERVRVQVAALVAAAGARSTPGDPAPIPRPDGTDAQGTFAVAVLGAVGQTYPPAAVAAAVLRVGQLMEASYAAIDRINEASAENRRIATREVYIRELIDQAVKTREMAEYEAAMAQARASYAAAAFRRWEEVVRTRLAADDRRRRYIALRLPLLWFHAEMARRDLASLDRSLGVWTGAWRGSGALRREMLRDPQLTRLALDEDIQLYQWLAEERDVESRRDDVERLGVHWRRVSELASVVLQNNQVGSAGGQIGTVVALNDGSGISSYMGPAEAARFRAWQAARGRNAQGQPVDFVLSIPLLPGTTLGGVAVTPRHGLRTVAVEVGLLNAAGAVTAAPNADVSHPGLSFVPTWDGPDGRFRYVEETMRPLEVVAAQPGAIPMAQYTARWLPGVPQGAFDGYGLLTTWRVRLRPEPATLAARDVVVRFVAQYNHMVQASPAGEIGEETFASANGSVAMDRGHLAPLLDNHGLAELVQRWSTTSVDGASNWPLWRHGVPVSGSGAYWNPASAPTSNSNGN